MKKKNYSKNYIFEDTSRCNRSKKLKYPKGSSMALTKSTYQNFNFQAQFRRTIRRKSLFSRPKGRKPPHIFVYICLRRLILKYVAQLIHYPSIRLKKQIFTISAPQHPSPSLNLGKTEFWYKVNCTPRYQIRRWYKH